MQSRNSDPSGIEKAIARNVKDLNENAASSSEVWHQNENTRSGIEKSMSKADQRSSIEKSTAKNTKFDSQKQDRPITTSRSSTLHTLRKSLRMYVRQKFSRPEQDQMLDLKVNGISDFEGSSSSRTGLRKKKNLFITKNTDLEKLKTLFDITQWQITLWRRSTSLHDTVIKLSKTRVHVCSESKLYLGKMHPHLAAMERWREQHEYLGSTNAYNRLFGESTESHLSSSGPLSQGTQQWNCSSRFRWT